MMEIDYEYRTEHNHHRDVLKDLDFVNSTQLSSLVMVLLEKLNEMNEEEDWVCPTCGDTYRRCASCEDLVVPKSEEVE